MLKEYIWGTEDWIYEDDSVLIKIIEAKRDLSVQVHPDDAYALQHEGCPGKSEAWFVIDAKPGAFVYCGFNRPVSREEVRAAALDGTITELLQKVYVKRGDVVNVPAGTVHALCEGVKVAEPQTCASVTYRLYDYGRLDADGKPRELHLDKALDVLWLGTGAAPQSKDACKCCDK